MVNVVNDEPIRLRDLVDITLSQEALEPVRWTGTGRQTHNPCSRRIRNDRLKELGYQLHHPTVFA